MQMQMECTGIDECEYVEFRFKLSQLYRVEAQQRDQGLLRCLRQWKG
jgi:hypothetical protein